MELVERQRGRMLFSNYRTRNNRTMFMGKRMVLLALVALVAATAPAVNAEGECEGTRAIAVSLDALQP
jgi:hypothetical protein